MIKLSISGGVIIHSISGVIEIPSKNGGAPFLKRELVIDDSWTSQDGAHHPNLVLIEYVGEKVHLLDNFLPGQRVNIDACVNGNEYNGRIYTRIKGLGITLYQAAQQQPVQQPMPQQPYGYQQPGFPPQPSFPQQAATPQQAPGTSDLPF